MPTRRAHCWPSLGSAVSCAPMPGERHGACTDDAILGGRLKLRQKRRGHRVGHDAVLLAAVAGAEAGEHAVDLGAGIGAAGLALAIRVPGITVTLVEIDAELAGLAEENAGRNGLDDRVRPVAHDGRGPGRTSRAGGI